MGLTSLNNADIEALQGEAQYLDPDLDLMDTAAAGFEEGWAAGPTVALRNAITSLAEDNLTAEEANEKYGLVDTEIAYQSGEMVSDAEARIASDRYYERQSNEAIMQRVSDERGFVGSAVAFGGSLTAGMVDPVNLAAGIGTSMAMRKMGTWAGKELLKGITTNTVSMTERVATKALMFQATGTQTVRSAVAAELAENFAASAITDLAIIPLGEGVSRQKTSTEQRIYNVLGGTFIGGALGTVGRMGAIREARKAGNRAFKLYGDSAIQLLPETMEHATMNVANGKKPNFNYAAEMMEMEHHLTRPGQTEYVFNPITADTLEGRRLFIGRRMDTQDLDVVSGRGDGTLVLTDSYNLAHNRVSSIKGDFDGEVLEIKLNANRKILTTDQYEGAKKSIRAAIKDEFDALEGARLRPKFLQDLQKIVVDSESIDDLVNRLHDGIEDWHKIPSIDNMVNSAIRKAGYDGYHFEMAPSTMDNIKYNGIVMFKPESFEPNYRGKNTMYVGRGKTTKGAVDSLSGNEKVFYNRNMLEVVQPLEDGNRARFDAEAPDSPAYLDAFKAKQMEEMKRLDSHKSDLDYDEAVMKEYNRAKVGSEEYDPYQDFLTDEGIDTTELDLLEGFEDTNKHIAAIKETDGYRKSLKAATRCILGK